MTTANLHEAVPESSFSPFERLVENITEPCGRFYLFSLAPQEFVEVVGETLDCFLDAVRDEIAKGLMELLGELPGRRVED